MNEWVVTEDASVNAFVEVGGALPDPGGFDAGYSLAVGSGPQRVCIAVRHAEENFMPGSLNEQIGRDIHEDGDCLGPPMCAFCRAEART